MAKKRSEKMFGRMVGEKRETSVIINVFLDRSTYDRFRAYIAKNNLDESNTLISVLERGMTNYWLQEFKQLKQDYHLMREISEEYKKDNETLKALEQQSEQLRARSIENGRR